MQISPHLCRFSGFCGEGFFCFGFIFLFFVGGVGVSVPFFFPPGTQASNFPARKKPPNCFCTTQKYAEDSSRIIVLNFHFKGNGVQQI